MLNMAVIYKVLQPKLQGLLAVQHGALAVSSTHGLRKFELTFFAYNNKLACLSMA